MDVAVEQQRDRAVGAREARAAVADVERGDHDIGSYDRGRHGPVVVACGGLHGNEPAGLEAIGRVLSRLAELELPMRGRLVGLAGNLGGLVARRRFVERDLNRHWGEDELTELVSRPHEDLTEEDREQRELVERFVDLEAGSDGPLTVLDLHSTSGASSPFLIMADTLRNRRVTAHLPAPIILGLEEALDGTLNSFLTERGHVAVALEGGQHDAEETVLAHEAALWLTLVGVGCLDRDQVPWLATARRRLTRAGRGLPRLLEVHYRHPVGPDDGFVMRPGYRSFQPVRHGERLAHDLRGELHAPFEALMLMPLYQEQGDDGYFLARPMKAGLLMASSWLRILRAERLLGLVPGVTAHPERRDRWIVDLRVAPLWIGRVLDLLGYRRRWRQGRLLEVGRRRPGHLGLRRRPMA